MLAARSLCRLFVSCSLFGLTPTSVAQSQRPEDIVQRALDAAVTVAQNFAIIGVTVYSGEGENIPLGNEVAERQAQQDTEINEYLAENGKQLPTGNSQAEYEARMQMRDVALTLGARKTVYINAWIAPTRINGATVKVVNIAFTDLVGKRVANTIQIHDLHAAPTSTELTKDMQDALIGAAKSLEIMPIPEDCRGAALLRQLI